MQCGNHVSPTLLHPFVLILVLAVLLAACGEDKQQQLLNNKRHVRPVELILDENGRPDPSVLAATQVLNRDNGEEPQTLDPHLAEGLPSAHVLRDLFEGLTSESPEGRIIPGAAIRWNISRDGKTYTFYLRRDAHWSNGDPVTSEDFVYSLRRSADPATASKYAAVLLPIENAAEVLNGDLPPSALGVSAMDEFTLQIRMKGPTPYFLALLNHPSTYPVHRASLETHGSAFSRPGNLVSNGAYTLADWVIRSRIELVKNPNYWDAGNVIIDKVVYYPFEDQSTALKRFRAGKLDWTSEVPNNQFKWLQQHYPDELVISPWLGSYFFGFNLEREPFVANPELRLALLLALDRDLLTQKVTQFGELPSYTLVPPGIMDYISPVPDWAEWTQAEREAEARRLYAEAGYSEEHPLKFEIRYTAGENNKKMALAAASLWKQVLGVQATLLNEENRVFLQNRDQKILTQVFQSGWISDYADPYSFLNLFRSGGGRNYYGYNNSLYDALLDEIAAERIPSRRRLLMYETERLLLTDVPFVPLYTYVTKRMVNPLLKGWQSNVMDHHYSKDMYFLKAATGEQPAAVPATEGQNQQQRYPAESDETAPIRQETEGLQDADDAETAGPEEDQGAAAPPETDTGSVTDETDRGGQAEDAATGAPEADTEALAPDAETDRGSPAAAVETGVPTGDSPSAVVKDDDGTGGGARR
jgi:oligopeptide transport system substrate-binding protein